MKHPFHLAFPVKNLNKTKDFYFNILGCQPGRSSSTWMDFDFYGHQLTVHLNPKAVRVLPFYKSDEMPFPPRHFGIILPWKEWHELAEKLEKLKIEFVISPQLFFEGEPGEQKIMFIQEPNGYFIEFKSFKSSSDIFKPNH